MKRIATLFTLAALTVAATAFATPNPNGVFTNFYIYQDCPPPFSTLVTTVNYPSLIQYQDTWICPSASFENLHNWSFSADGGTTEAVFNNADAFRFGADFSIAGGFAEGGIRISPWWGKETEGRINCKITNDGGTGEIACFGGYCPFYSFTVSNGIKYTGGVIHLEMIYKPNALSASDPGTMEYLVRYQGGTYDSGPLACGPANPSDPPHGTYGMEDDGRAGGIFAPFVGASGAGNGPGTATGTWSNIFFTGLPTPTNKTTWGQLKNLYK